MGPSLGDSLTVQRKAQGAWLLSLALPPAWLLASVAFVAAEVSWMKLFENSYLV